MDEIPRAIKHMITSDLCLRPHLHCLARSAGSFCQAAASSCIVANAEQSLQQFPVVAQLLAGCRGRESSRAGGDWELVAKRHCLQVKN